jgi:hypothetical protein
MEEVHGSYNDSDATWGAVSGVQKIIIDDFTTNEANNIKYKNACENEGGTYEELTYEANCESASVCLSECNPVHEITLQVIGQPRCYAKNCAAAIGSDKDFANELLEEFTLKPTAERANEKHDPTSAGWTCTGELNDASQANANTGSGGGCAFATNMLYEQTTDIISAVVNMKPDVTDKKFLFFLPTEVKKVEYSASPVALENACHSVSGHYLLRQFEMTCTVDEGNTQDKASFEVLDYSVCLASVCGNSNTNAAAKEETIYLRFKDQMLDEKNLDETKDWTCIGSGAMAVSIRVAVGAVFALWWNLSM